jgi:hypothetical protein
VPWPPKQRTAIFLETKRRKGAAAASRVMHEAGYGKSPLVRSLVKKGRP